MLTFSMTFFQIITIVLGIYILSNNRLGLKLFVIMIFVGQGVGYLLYMLVGIVGIFLIIFFFIICLFLRTKHLFGNILLTLVTAILFVLSGYITELVSMYFFVESFQILKEDDYFVMSVVIVSSILTIIMCCLVRYIFSKLQIYRVLNKTYGVLILYCTMITLLIFYVNILIGEQQGFSNENIRANGVLFLLYVVLLFVIFIIMTRIIIKDIQMKNERIQSKQFLEYLEKVEEGYEEIRKFRHDYINMLSTMIEYINEKDMEMLATYFFEKIVPIGKRVESNEYKLGVLSSIKVKEIKGIVATKLIRAQELQIDTTIELEGPISQLNVDTMDLCRSLGIILDNAIEEAKLCENPTIEIAFIKIEGSHIIIVKNSSRENIPTIQQIYQKGFSTKGHNRGNGLSILREILMRHEHVHLSTYMKECYFVQEIEIDKRC